MIRLGVSEFAAAVGVCPYTSRAQLWRYKLGIKIKPVVAAMEWGKRFEPNAVATTEKRSGIAFFCTGDQQKKFRQGRLTAMPDGVHDSTALEVKVRAIKNKPHEEIPLHYMCQIQGQMEVGKFSQVVFASWTMKDCRIWRVPYSEEFCGVMMPLVKDYFWWLDLELEPPRFGRGKKPQLPVVMPYLLYEGRS